MIGVCGDEKAGALREFREAKASAARRACEKLPSGNLLVGEILQPFFGTTFWPPAFQRRGLCPPLRRSARKLATLNPSRIGMRLSAK